MNPTYLIVTDTRCAHGTGHIRRSFRTCRGLSGSAAVCLDFPWDGLVRDQEDCLALSDGSEQVALVSWQTIETVTPTLIVLDTQTLTVAEMLRLLSVAPVVGIDTGGEGRAYASFLIDTLVNLETHQPNLYVPDALDLPPRVRTTPPSSGSRALICMGGDDIAELTEPLLQAVALSNQLGPGSVDIVLPATCFEPAHGLPQRLEGFPVTGRVYTTNRLAALLGEYDIVFCTFGLTAVEALAAGCTVITCAPTAYHAELTRKASLPLLDPPAVETIEAVFDRIHEIWKHQETLRPLQETTLAELIASLDPSGCVGEPSGGPPRTPVVMRLPARSFRPEEHSGLLYLERFHPLTIEYNEEYFDEAYAKQYGCSYLDDFEHIRTMGVQRLRRVATLLRRADRGQKKGRLLDIGCAYGPFLSAAASHGYDCVGTDVFARAVAYVRDELGIPAFVSDATDLSRDRADELHNGVDVVSMWYVIEHIDDLDRLFTAIRNLLVPGGVLAFSTPNGSGVSARRSLRSFLAASPEDHRTVWNPQSARRYLSEQGFGSVRIRITGHHPERIAPRLANNRLGYRIVHLYSRLRGLGDTFEAYARRVGR